MSTIVKQALSIGFIPANTVDDVIGKNEQAKQKD